MSLQSQDNGSAEEQPIFKKDRKRHIVRTGGTRGKNGVEYRQSWTSPTSKRKALEDCEALQLVTNLQSQCSQALHVYQEVEKRRQHEGLKGQRREQRFGSQEVLLDTMENACHSFLWARERMKDASAPGRNARAGHMGALEASPSSTTSPAMASFASCHSYPQQGTDWACSPAVGLSSVEGFAGPSSAMSRPGNSYVPPSSLLRNCSPASLGCNPTPDEELPLLDPDLFAAMDHMADELVCQSDFKGFCQLPSRLSGTFQAPGMPVNMAGRACALPMQLTRQGSADPSRQLPFHQTPSTYATLDAHDRFPGQFSQPTNTDYTGFAYDIHQP